MARKRFDSRGPRRRYQWVRKFQIATQVAPGSQIDFIEVTDGNVIAEAMSAPTLVRIRGDILLTADAGTAVPGENALVGVGVILVKSTVDGSEVGGPLTNPNLDWMYWRVLTLAIGTTGSEEAPPGSVRLAIDVKAMRKWSKSKVLFIVQNLGTSVFDIFAGGGLSFLFQE